MIKRYVILLLLAVPAFIASVIRLDTFQRKDISPEMEVVLPVLVQIAMAGGDRYLAANMGTVRATISDTERMDPEAFRVLGKVQSDAAWLNPAQEDNYYIASAILPWNGQFDAGQYVLRQAIDGRPFDMWPSFYYGFNLYHFKRDPVAGAEWLRLGSTKTRDETESLILNDMAVRWVKNGADSQTAIRILRAMSETARSSGFKAHLRKHVLRLENLRDIENAVGEFSKKHNRPPNGTAELVQSGVIKVVPVDPFGGRYVLDGQGRAKVVERQQ